MAASPLSSLVDVKQALEETNTETYKRDRGEGQKDGLLGDGGANGADPADGGGENCTDIGHERGKSECVH